MINIIINKKIIEILRDYHIISDYLGSCYIAVVAMYNKDYELLNELDKDNSDKLFLEIYKDMEIKGIVEKSLDTKETLFELTALGTLLAEELLREQREKPKQVEKIVGLDWVEEWINLWKDSKGIFYKSGNRSLRISLKDANTRFIGFLKAYEDIFVNNEENIKDIIINSTKNYLKEQYKEGFAYTRNPKNFISKVEGFTKDTKTSDLAAYCEEYISSKDKIEEKRLVRAYDTSIN